MVTQPTIGFGSYFSSRMGFVVSVSCIAFVCTDVVRSDVVTYRLDSEKLAGNLMGARSTNLIAEVYLPPGYDETDQRYPVLYWFGGWGLGSTNPMGEISALSIDQAIESGRVPPTIVVSMPVDAPAFDHTMYLSSNVFGDWEGFASSEVIPSIDQSFRTIASSDKRGIAGFSAGGFTALMLPILNPNTWGAIGAIDPSSWTIGSAVRDPEDWPELEVLKPAEVRRAFARMPNELAGFSGTGPIQIESQWYGQVGARLSPNPASPIFADFPIDRNGEWNPNAREAWQQYDLGEPAMARQHKDVLLDMATINVVIPEEETRSVALWNRELVESLKQIGVNATATHWPGEHGSDLNRRFISMLETVSGALMADDLGDMNRNGRVDPHDLQFLINNISLGSSHPRFDINSDRNVDHLDAHFLASIIGEPIAEQLTVGQSYTQNFHSLGVTAEQSALPPGWTVANKSGFPILNRTNLSFPTSEMATLGSESLFALNAGDSEDRSLAIYKPPIAEPTSIQLLADTSNSDANAMRINFSVEAWQRVRESEDERGAAAFGFVVDIATGDEVSDPAAIVQGGEFVELFEISPITTREITSVSGSIVDGNAPAHRVVFDSSTLPVDIPAGSRLRFRWITADEHEASEGWVFGIDDVDISLMFLGDFDGSGELNLADLNVLQAAIVGGSLESKWDLNGDQTVNASDLIFWVRGLRSTWLGDANLDGEFESGDFIDVFQASKYESGEAASWRQGDWNADGVFDSGDLVVALQDGGYEDRGPIALIVDVPEPLSHWVATILALAWIATTKKQAFAREES